MLEIAIISIVMILLSVLGLVWDFASGLIAAGVDGIMLLLVCLMLGGVFTFQLLLYLRQKTRSGGASSGR